MSDMKIGQRTVNIQTVDESRETATEQKTDSVFKDGLSPKGVKHIPLNTNRLVVIPKKTTKDDQALTRMVKNIIENDVTARIIDPKQTSTLGKRKRS